MQNIVGCGSIKELRNSDPMQPQVCKDGIFNVKIPRYIREEYLQKYQIYSGRISQEFLTYR